MAISTANSSQLLSASKVYEVLQFFYAPSSANVENVLYSFVGSVSPWPDPFNPPSPSQSQRDIKQVFKNIILTKKINSSDLSAVVPRRDWTANTVYDYYRDDVDMLSYDSNALLTKNFYVRNRFDQVFKCLWNANGAPSTIEPSFLPGSYTNNFLVNTDDGYKWKLLYNINGGIKQKFLDDSWMPVPIALNYPNPLIDSKGTGCVEVINVTRQGQGYTSGGVTIDIVGDGTGANATPVINASGFLTDVIVTSVGSDYTTANAVISVLPGYSTPNVTALTVTPVSPVDGHGYDPLSELGCNHIMVTTQFSGSEGGLLPTDISYYQLGLILNPVATSTNPNYANNSIYDVTTQINVSAGIGTFVSGQTVYQGPSIVDATFRGIVVSFNPTTNLLKVINTFGTPSINAALLQDANGPVGAAVRTLLSYQEPDFVIMSGYLTYIENRAAIDRSADGTEQFRIVLSF